MKELELESATSDSASVDHHVLIQDSFTQQPGSDTLAEEAENRLKATGVLWAGF